MSASAYTTWYVYFILCFIGWYCFCIQYHRRSCAALCSTVLFHLTCASNNSMKGKTHYRYLLYTLQNIGTHETI